MKPRRFDFDPDRFIAGVSAQLTPVEMGVYWIVCSLMYSKRGPIDDDPHWLAGIFKKGTDPRTVKAALDSLEMREKLQRVGSKLVVKSCQDEIEAAANRMRTSHENGSKGGRVSNKIKGEDADMGSDKKNPPALPLPIPPSIPEKDTAPQGGARPAKKGSRLSEDWKPSGADIAYADNLGLDASLVAPRFRDWWLAAAGAKGVKLDWSATWRTWCRSTADRGECKRAKPAVTSHLTATEAIWRQRLSKAWREWAEGKRRDKPYWHVDWGPNPSEWDTKVPDEFLKEIGLTRTPKPEMANRGQLDLVRRTTP